MMMKVKLYCTHGNCTNESKWVVLSQFSTELYEELCDEHAAPYRNDETCKVIEAHATP